MVAKKVIPTDMTAAREAAEEVLARVEAGGCRAEVLFAVRLALEEALANAIKHGNRYDRAKTITVSAEVGAEETAITVADEGPGFDPRHLPDPRADENLEKPGGRGIMLMRAYMDEVAFNERGNEVRMIKRTSSASRAGAPPRPDADRGGGP